MKNLILLTFLFGLIASTAYAQSTATQATPCIPTTSGCPVGTSSCCLPVTPTNPMPVVSE